MKLKTPNPFYKVGGLRPKRNLFNMSYQKLFDCDFGELIPCYIEECVAGDKVSYHNNYVIRTQPLKTPILQPIKVYTEYFFVPFRLVWDSWTDFFTGGKDGTLAPTIPNYGNIETATTFSTNSLAGYLEYPTDVIIPTESLPNCFYGRAYNLIWNEYYRDETIDQEISLDSVAINKRRWKKDYFTSALPFPQRGISQSVPVTFSELSLTGSQADVDIYHRTYTPPSDGSFYNFAVSPYLYLGSSASNIPIASGLNHSSTNASFPSSTLDGTTIVDRFVTSVGPHADVSYLYKHSVNPQDIAPFLSVPSQGSNIGFTIDQLRLSVQIQKFFERAARSGYRYNEFLTAQFGVCPNDNTLQRPLYLGGNSSYINVSEVLQTSATEDGSVQGNLAGRGLAVSGGKVFTFIAPEPGMLIGLFSIMPVCMYDNQGIDKRFTKRSRFDFYFPTFAHLSEQPIKTRELYITGTNAGDDVIFGYQPIYQEYRHRRSIAVGQFKATGYYKEWTLTRHFISAPTLSPEFLEVDTDGQRVFATDLVNSFMVNFGNVVRFARPIPVLGEPGFVDHF